METAYFLDLALALLFGVVIGVERELKGKAAGISTHTLVIGASMTFAFLSRMVLGSDPTRIAAQVVSGVGFLGAGMILKSESGQVNNLTTAASVWYSSAVGLMLGYDYHWIALMAAVYSVVVSRIPSFRRR